MSEESPFARHWLLAGEVAYLNHGSYGACPKPVLDHQQGLRYRVEREAVDFFNRDLPGLLASARAEVAGFVGCDPDDLAFVSNATTAVNTVLRSMELSPGDELLTTSHVYAACWKAMEFVASRAGARVVIANVPFPLTGEDDVVQPVLAAVTSRTRLAVLDHVTSPTALVFPIERLASELEYRGVPVLVDGAHALGMRPLDLRSLGASYYTANAHKWLCAPKGAAIFHVRKDRQAGLHPLVISHGYDPSNPGRRFREEFDWTGTTDVTAALSIPECLRFLGSLVPGGWPELMARNHALAVEARGLLCEALGVEPPCPEAMVGALAAVPLPDAAPGSPVATLDIDPLTLWFRERGVEPWFTNWACPGGKLVRVSAQLYNARAQYARLAELLVEALGRGK